MALTLWTDVVDPAYLSGYTRTEAENIEIESQSRGQTLASFLPNRTADDIEVKFVVGEAGLTEVAEYRAYDAETPIGDTPGGKRVTLELPPLGRKYHWSEYDQLRARGRASDQNVVLSAERLARMAANAVVDRLELARGQIIDTGKATINENNFIAESDFGRKPEFNVSVEKMWDDPDSDPIQDLLALREEYSDENGTGPGTILTSTRVFSILTRSLAVRNLLSVGSTVPSIATREAVNQLLGTFELPQISVYDRKVRKGGKFVRTTPANKLYFLPEAGPIQDEAGTLLGGTILGRTLEADDPRYGLPAGAEPGVVVGAYREEDPLSSWIRSAAIGMPVLANANLSMAVKVFAD